jgi:flagellar hook-associated protein 1 FlgK
MSSFGSLSTALSGLLTARTGIDTASHNVSNANTRGYTRQLVTQTARRPIATTDGFIGTGAQIADIGRARDGFLDARVRGANRSFGEASQRSELLTRAEQVMGEPDQGITAAVGDVWAAFEDLALNPPDTAARTNVLSTLGNLTNRVRTVSQGWDRLEADGAQHLGSLVDDVNATLAQVATLNAKIRDQGATAGRPNDLEDQRDLLLDELSTKVGATFTTVDDGSVRVSVNGLALVDGTHVSAMSLDPETHVITHANGATLTPGGEVAGVQRFLTQDLDGLRSSLDAWVADLTTAVNAQHAAGESSAGVAGGPLLGFTPGAAAATFGVVLTDPALVAASKAPYAEFDGGNAQAIGNLRTDATLSLGGTETLDGGIRTLVSTLAGTVSEVQANARTEEDIAAAAELSRQGQHGVSIDEEMVSLLQYQHAYSAAARVMTTIDGALDTLINRTGLVGR